MTVVIPLTNSAADLVPPVIISKALAIRTYTTLDLQQGLKLGAYDHKTATPDTSHLLDVVVRGYDVPRFKYGIVTAPRFLSATEFAEVFSPDGVLTVLYKDDVPIATAGIRFYEDDMTRADPVHRRYCELKCLAVDPAVTAKGYASLLVENAHQLAKELGYHVIVAQVIVEHELDSFYLKRGYIYCSDFKCGVNSAKEENGVEQFFCSREFTLRKFTRELTD
ncbi:hypothetical protein NADFUDRAFT_49596 [Nadsonia fulvescens var. elongata DSM 6958]|uniref:N-acetyltransferase domain-containing protein n=1 Tax=Nadsonia fulvescens var. elongata DSM 6958 TaxID=857566 RepID=A0A1E3PNZ6_9ASCO|nr:hypothetical protein NADFUDRAFT_49596 [Nadsonia fulvescens var. elongata DSM 6958]